MTVMAGRRRDDGLSLVELVVAIALLGIGVVAILGAYATLIVSGDRAKKHGDVSTVLAAAAASVLDPARNPYDPCASNATYDATRGVVLPNGFPGQQVSVTKVLFWDGATFQPTCYDQSAGTLARLQQITVQVRSADDRVSEQLTVVKRGS